MADPKQPTSKNTLGSGFTTRLVQIQSITPDGQTAICTDRQGVEVRVPMLIQRAKGSLPAAGEWWLVTQDLTSQWTFSAIVTNSADPFLPQAGTPPAPGSVPGSAIAPGSLPGTALETQSIGALQLAANAAGTNIIVDPQFKSAAINSNRLADPATTGGWTMASPCTTTTGTDTATLALMPSDLVPLYVNPGEQYYLQVSVTLSAGTASAGIQFAFDNGSFLGPLLPVSAGTSTVAQLVTIPAGVASAYVRLIVTGLAPGATCQFCNPTCYITIGHDQLQVNSVDASNIVANTIGVAQLQAGIVVAGIVDSTYIQAATLAAGTLLIYSGTPGPGTLVGAFASGPGTDQYGNSYVAGVTATQATFQGVTITGSSYSGGSLATTAITNSTISNSMIQGGSASEMSLTFDQVGGQLLIYGTTTTTVTITNPATSSWTAPAGSYTQGKVECWGAGPGGSGGGSTRGGESGGGGEWAAEPSYPLVPGQVYSIQIGQGGVGAPNGHSGSDGGDTIFDNGGVYANGGTAGTGWNAGPGGTGSQNSLHHPGGAGASSGNVTGGSSGGNSGNPSSAGNHGFSTGGTSGAGPPTAQTDSGEGGTGGNNAGNGVSGTTPGGAGGGAGAGSASVSGSYQYRFSDSATYYGMNGGTPGGLRAHGTMYQGGETASGGTYNGDMCSLGIIGGNPNGDLAGKTIDTVSIRFNNLHSWYSNGMYLLIGYTPFTYLGGNWNGGSVTSLAQKWINQNATTTYDLTGLGLGTALQNNTANSISLGYNGQPSYDLWNYGYCYGAGGSNSLNPLITVTWHTGTAPTKGGNGGNGEIRITYISSQILIGAVAAAAGTDSAGNAFGTDFTGQIQAFQYGSSPAAVESWHSLTPLPSGLTGSARYKLVAEASMIILDVNVQWTTTAATTFTLPSIPTGYVPSGPGALPRVYTMCGNSTIVTSSNTAMGRLYLSGGGVQVIVPASTGGGTASCTVIVPTN